eukprot:TRINITY_DN1279_c0_g1_i4.p1 TRINITY_DN1279_c0_g1~~TRINITY_DN1279_c0_g1_i4.p1  ORF type:complete len:204 (-),score=53.26 TRINITY_DN1279_c0_g1_i4:165-776(-)
MASKSTFQIILGSASEARQSVLREMGFDFNVITADIDEKAIRRHNAEDLVMALAEAKAEAIRRKLEHMQDTQHTSKTTLLITADQVVVHEGLIKEKPSTEEEARQFIKGYLRAPACTVGSVLVSNLKTGMKKGGLDKAEVYFHPIPDEVIESLIKEGMVFKAAGGLLVEHPLTSPFVEAVVGTIDSVMGLPKELTQSLIAAVL